MLIRHVFIFIKRARAWSPGALARNTALATGWQVIRLGLQMLYLVLVARLLGVDGYGAFAGIVAMASSLSPLAGSGFSLILVKQISRRIETFPIYWARTLTAIIFCAIPLVSAVFLLSIFLLPSNINHFAVISVASSELLFVPTIAACANVYQAHEKLGRSTFNFVLLNLFRLIAVICLVFYSRKISLDLFASTYFLTTGLSAIFCLIRIRQQFGRAFWNLNGMQKELKEGLGFSLSGVANSAHNEIDKTLLLRIDNAVSAGHYSVASRVISAASLPLISYTLAVVPKLFREGGQGIRTGAKLALKLLPPVIIYGTFSGAAIFILAPLIQFLLGNEFSKSIKVIQWLSVLPLLTGISNLFLGVLSCSGAQRTRIIIESISVALNIGLNLILIPLLGIKGVIISSLTSQITLTIFTTIILIRTPIRQVYK